MAQGFGLASGQIHLSQGARAAGGLPRLPAIATLTLQSIHFETLGAMVSSLATMAACGERRIAHLIGVPPAPGAFIHQVFCWRFASTCPEETSTCVQI